MSKIAVVAKLTAAEGKRDDLVAAMGPMMEAAQAEAGTEVYALHTDLGDENAVWLYELYTDSAALDAHSSSEAMAAFGASLGGLLDGALEIMLLDPVSSTGL
ncbi:MAG TPA: putative quinol monooxygenase [Acidimicrobiales bacterium]|nr:putative quinol monooxygenase [Acidimicrobiales bacterium]